MPAEETEEEFVLEKPKLQNFKEELEQEEKAEAEAKLKAEQEENEAEDETEGAEVEAEDEKETEDKPNFYAVIEELKKKNQNKKDKNLSYSDNSKNNSFILNNR